jgi:ribosome-associated toxin RatA of RatAB toxin-antitoxin module
VRSFLLVFLICIGTHSSSLSSDWSPRSVRFKEGELARLARGEVLVRVGGHDSDRKGRVLAAILINSPARQIWNIMIDCDRAPEFVPGLRSCRVLDRHESMEIIEHRVKFSMLQPTVTYVFRALYQNLRRIDFIRVGGYFRELEGSWILEQINGRQTIVVYSVYLDPGFPVPQWLVRRILRGELPDFLLALRNRVSELSQD